MPYPGTSSGRAGDIAIQTGTARNQVSHSGKLKRELNTNRPLCTTQAPEGVRKLSPDEGEKLKVAGVDLTWKVKSEDSGNAFCVCEHTLAPGDGVPVHSHASPEFFYILEGAPEFLRITDGEGQWFRSEVGSFITVPPNAWHAFRNDTSEACRILDIFAPSRQSFFDALAGADKSRPFASLPASEAMRIIGDIGAETDMYFALGDMSGVSSE